MKPCPKNKRLDFWKYSYARESFIKTKELCELLLKLDRNNKTELISLTISIATFYARPFKQRKSVRLSDKIIPEEFAETHLNMITIRDKCIAHKDLDAPNQLHLIYQNKRVSVHTVSPLLGEEQATNLVKLATKLLEKVEYHMGRFSKEFIHKSQLRDGHYLLSLEEDEASWLLKEN